MPTRPSDRDRCHGDQEWRRKHALDRDSPRRSGFPRLGASGYSTNGRYRAERCAPGAGPMHFSGQGERPPRISANAQQIQGQCGHFGEGASKSARYFTKVFCDLNHMLTRCCAWLRALRHIPFPARQRAAPGRARSRPFAAPDNASYALNPCRTGLPASGNEHAMASGHDPATCQNVTLLTFQCSSCPSFRRQA